MRKLTEKFRLAVTSILTVLAYFAVAAYVATAMPQERERRVDRGTVRENRNMRVPRRGDDVILRDRNGEYRGRVNRNRNDRESIANPNGRYGRRWERDSQTRRRNLRVYEKRWP